MTANYKLSDIAEVYDGVHQTPHYTESGIRFISVEDISDIYSSKKYISNEDYAIYKHVPEKGDVIMTRIGTIGQCAVVTRSEPIAYYVSVSLIKPDNTIIDSIYLKYYIESDYGKNELRMRSLLEAFPMKINLNEIGKIRVIVPSINEQKQFVAIVQQADKSKFDGLKSQFIEMFGRVSDKESKYPVLKLVDCCSYISDGSHFSPEGKTDGKYPMLSVKDMTETGFTYSDCKYIDEKDYCFLVQNGCKPLLGDVLVAKDGSYFKYAFALKEETEQAILSSIAILRPIESLVLSRYLAYYMLTDAVIQLVEDNYLTGTAIKRVILKGFKEIPIIVPPIEHQAQFVTILNQADKSKYLN